MRQPIKRRSLGENKLGGLGQKISGFFSGLANSKERARINEEFDNDMARIHGQQAYYQGSSSSDETKRKVAIKMGRR